MLLAERGGIDALEAGVNACHRCNLGFPMGRWSIPQKESTDSIPLKQLPCETLETEDTAPKCPRIPGPDLRRRKGLHGFCLADHLSNIKELWEWGLLYCFYQESGTSFCFSGKGFSWARVSEALIILICVVSWPLLLAFLRNQDLQANYGNGNTSCLLF